MSEDRRLFDYDSTTGITEYKTCRICLLEKPKSEFYRVKTRQNSVRSRCKPCDGRYAAAWSKRHPHKMRDASRLRLYGVTAQEFKVMFGKQEGRCAICAEPLPKESQRDLDHCHETKVVRGILCRACNIGLGKFRDDPNHLRKAAAYLELSAGK